MEKRKEQRVAIGIGVSTRGNLIVESRTDIMNHTYTMTLNLWELERSGGKRSAEAE